MPIKTPDGTKIYQTEDRQYKVKEQLLQSMFNCVNGFPDIIISADKKDPYGDPRFDAMTMLLTTYTLSEEECIKLLDEREQMISEKVDFEKDPTLKQNRKIFNINIRIIAKCHAHFDNYYGIKKRQEIMRVNSPEIDEAIEEFGGDDALGLMFSNTFEEGEASDE